MSCFDKWRGRIFIVFYIPGYFIYVIASTILITLTSVASSLQVQRYKLKCAVYNIWRIIARKSHYHSVCNCFIISVLSTIFRSDSSIFPAIFSAILAISTTMPYFEVKKGKKRQGVTKLPRVLNLTPSLVTGTPFLPPYRPLMSSLTHILTFGYLHSHIVMWHHTLPYYRVIIIYRQNLLQVCTKLSFSF